MQSCVKLNAHDDHSSRYPGIIADVMHSTTRESRRLVHKPPPVPRSRSTSRSRATESFSVLPPLSPQIPAPPRTPEPYRLTPTQVKRDTRNAFVILPEVSPPVRSRSPSPGGRASPFKIRTFRESTLPSRHASREPSPEKRKSILKRKSSLSSSPTRFTAKLPPTDYRRRQSLSPGRAILIENRFKGPQPRSKSTPRIPPPKICVTDDNKKDFLNRRKISRSVSPARRKPGDKPTSDVNSKVDKAKGDLLTVENLDDKENDLPNNQNEKAPSVKTADTLDTKDPGSSKPPPKPANSPKKNVTKVQNNAAKKALNSTSPRKSINSNENKSNFSKSPQKENPNLKSPTPRSRSSSKSPAKKASDSKTNDMSQRSKYTTGFNSQRTISPSRNSTLKKNANKTPVVAKPVSKQPVVAPRPTTLKNEKKKEDAKKEYMKTDMNPLGDGKEEEKEPMLPKENGEEKNVEVKSEAPKNGSVSVVENNNNSPKKNSPKKETPKTSPTKKSTPVRSPSKSPKRVEPRKRSLTRDDTSKSLPVEEITPTAPITLMRTSTAPALAAAHPDIANRVTTAVESHMSPKSPNRKIINKKINEQLSKVSEVPSMSKESIRSNFSTETVRAVGKEGSPVRIKKNGLVQTVMVKEEPEVEVLSANNLMRNDMVNNNGHRNIAWDRPDNHIAVETDNTTDDEPESVTPRSCCCFNLFSRCKCCNTCLHKCKQSKMYDRIGNAAQCCQSKCCGGLTSRLGTLCGKLKCKGLSKLACCSKLSCCGKLKGASSCCKRTPREVDVEGQGSEPKVTCAKRLKNMWRFLCCLNTGCCRRIQDKCGCCKRLACCKMGGCCGPLTPEEEVERQKRNRMKKSKKNSRQTSMNKEQSKIDPSMVEHQSIMRAGIPILPVGLAWICMILNVLIPGSGTFMSGLFCLCVGKPRFQVNDTPFGRLGAFIVQCLVALAQVFTILFCLVGWGWSIWWGTIMLKLAKKHQRMKQAERNETEAPVTNQNHVVDNI
ncbi:hypothetical protein M8J76_014779 [Diaphorina citri]|nr:hypothetical protein M8J76_014779 [Diaphorina citri]